MHGLKGLIKETENRGALFNSMHLLLAYEHAIDENVISTITDAKGIIVHANKKFQDISQYSEAEVIGQNHRIVNSGHHPREFFENLWSTIASGKVWHQEVKNRAKDGTFYWVDTVIVPIRDGREKITHYLSLRALITERKELELKNEHYVSSLEVLLVMTSNKLKKPLSDCLKQMNAFDGNKSNAVAELNNIVQNLKLSVTELEKFTSELSLFIREM
jgi:PAS domain S-box-containing protein